MPDLQLARVKADLDTYLHEKDSLFSSGFASVVADVAAFASAVLEHGFSRAFFRLPNAQPEIVERPFIEVADVLVDHHLRLVQADRDLIRKSVLEAYIHVAGPHNVFQRPVKTRLVRSLRRSGITSFATLLFSLHTFNVVSITIQERVRAEMPDVKTFELYMIAVETLCCDAVEESVTAHAVTSLPDEKWAQSIADSVDAHLLHSPIKPAPAPDDSILKVTPK